MSAKYFPLRWESTGDQWWYASPIDWAAANGHYDLVRELLHLDTNLLIKLTSLRRIRRLETVWDDEAQFNDVAQCRSQVAQKLLSECETKRGHNSLIRAGYGGWLLYTAASAGDVGFVKELLERYPLLVFGEGEYGVTDIFYAAARSKNSQVFRLLLDLSVSQKCVNGNGKELEGPSEEILLVFRWEMMNRAVHAAARGGNVGILRELLGDCSDVLTYRDAEGSTILHTASGRGQVEVVKDLLASYEIITSKDSQGNTALHVAAYRGYLAVVEVLIFASPSSTSLTNNYGDTFLHMAVAGFRTPAFRRLDRQIELMKKLVCGNIVNMEDIINVRNNDGRTALHMAVTENIHSDLVELLMTVPAINLNIRDADGMTPLDLLKQRPRSASSEILIKRLISAGGISNCRDYMTRSALVSHLRMQGIGCSPGTSFRIPDAEIFLYTGIENASDAAGYEPASTEYSTCSSELSKFDSTAESNSMDYKKSSSVNNAARRLKILLQWPRRKERKVDSLGDDDSVEQHKTCRNLDDCPTPLRQQFSKPSSLPNNKRILSIRSYLPSPSTKKRFAAGLMHGVIQAGPQLAVQSTSSPFSESNRSSPIPFDKQKGVYIENEIGGSSGLNHSLNGEKLNINDKQTSVNKRLMNQYFCFGAQGIVVEDSYSYTRSHQSYESPCSSTA
ncbi:uncharacterized protein LOC132304196 [Cornus florida]|uniref:uncharacterized protein LOC132304196 n=1 Tax=Cornus florida TaxID=4283 RepID=UPI0028A070FE|nr:uncharacterized protein LOC132304196 [Cornus florida]